MAWRLPPASCCHTLLRIAFQSLLAILAGCSRELAPYCLPMAMTVPQLPKSQTMPWFPDPPEPPKTKRRLPERLYPPWNSAPPSAPQALKTPAPELPPLISWRRTCGGRTLSKWPLPLCRKCIWLQLQVPPSFSLLQPAHQQVWSKAGKKLYLSSRLFARSL